LSKKSVANPQSLETKNFWISITRQKSRADEASSCRHLAPELNITVEAAVLHLRAIIIALFLYTLWKLPEFRSMAKALGEATASAQPRWRTAGD